MKMQYERSHGRQQALQVLFQEEVTGQTLTQMLEEGTCSSETGNLDDFAADLVRGVEANRDTIDMRLGQISENWSVSRMSIVDRNVLRIAVYEISFDESIPASVAINEAVELAKAFGDENSSKFVNGVLGRVVRDDDEDISTPLDLPSDQALREGAPEE